MLRHHFEPYKNPVTLLVSGLNPSPGTICTNWKIMIWLMGFQTFEMPNSELAIFQQLGFGNESVYKLSFIQENFLMVNIFLLLSWICQVISESQQYFLAKSISWFQASFPRCENMNKTGSNFLSTHICKKNLEDAGCQIWTAKYECCLFSLSCRWSKPATFGFHFFSF